ncbi:MAG TPA: energy transducer TonB [Allosphingosinicella sp.]|nr:energy transducer TonB [Allosphingosinicella sp.]
MHGPRAALAAMLLPALAGAALAQQRAGAPARRPPPAWQVDWGHHYCSMIRLPGPGRSYATAILTVPGGENAQILLIQQGSTSLPRRVSTILLAPGGRSFQTTSQLEDRGNRRVLAISGLSRDFRDALAEAGELQLKDGDVLRARIPLAGARAAAAAHRECMTEVARQWGIDEAAMAALQRPAATTNFHGLTSDDYPRSALRTATQGRVIVRLAVSAAGRATECTIVATSGNSDIDATTCRVILARGRFQAGLDAAGRPVDVRMISTVTWRLPQH